MIPLDEARAHVLDRVAPLAPVAVGIDEALGLVVAEAVTASEAVPPFVNTAMDGYAVRAADTRGAPVTLTVVGTVAAGDDPTVVVGPGQAARIMTGAPLPDGADAVVMVELTRADDEAGTVVVETSVEPGNHLRGVGEDVQPGDRVIAAGTELRPGHLGVLASVGTFTVVAHPRPRVGVVSTGDELVDGPGPLRRGQIRDSNRRTLLALCARAGFEPVDLGLARDDPAALKEVFGRGLETCDAVLSSGGVSMGAFDYVKVVLDEIADMRWMQVAIKPAKPLAFGVANGVPVFGLPGNPVSSMVSFELFARPALRRLAGHSDIDRRRVRAVAPEGLTRRRDGKTHFLRVVGGPDETGRWTVRSAGGQGSHQLSVMAEATALAVVPDGEGVEPGGEVEIIPLD
ncbi:MAG: molybdopterin molybdenumtransferase MoeA [Actinomyces sp.]|nr:MAG: molybdopterin molybdenumtransferase MoeA [Actinomyces sp.]